MALDRNARAVAVALSALANLIGHARQDTVKWRCALVFAAAGVVGAALGSTFGKQFDGQKLLVLFGALMIVIAGLMFFKKSTDGNVGVRLNRSTAPDLLPLLLNMALVLAHFQGSSALEAVFSLCLD